MNEQGEVYMFWNKKEEKTKNQDVDMLKAAMKQIINGDFSAISLEGYTDPELPEMFNQAIGAVKRFNNNFILRLNEAMMTIADNSYIKNLLDEVESQTADIENMKNSSITMEESIRNILNYMGSIRNNINAMLSASDKSTSNMNDSVEAVNESAEQIRRINDQLQMFHGKIDEIGKIVDVVKDVASQSNLLALNASIEAARAGEAGRGFAVVAEQVRELSTNTAQSASDIVKYVHELQEDIALLASSMDETTKKLSSGNEKVESSIGDIRRMNEQMTTINDATNGIMDDINKQSGITRDFAMKVSNIADSYGVLNSLCKENGEHFRKISRAIDTTRSDMFRRASDLTVQDRLKVFEVDHFILMWRVYFHVIGMETLRLNQVNAPDRCKIGLWMAEQTDPRLVNSTQFKEVYRTHKELHQYATESWYAKDKNDVDKALALFQKCFDSYFVYQQKIHELMDYMSTIGYNDRTEIVIFSK